MVNKKLTVTQPHVYCDKVLYKQYRKLVKAHNRDLTTHNTVIFENAVKREIEALEAIDPKPKQKPFAE